MNKFLQGIAALVSLAASVPAHAGDLATPGYYGKAPAASLGPIFSWTGFYLGGHVGGAFSSNEVLNGLVTGNNSNARLLGGLQGGFDYQFAPNWVAGIEGQYSWLGNKDGIIFPGGFVYTNTRPAIGSLTGRIGFAFGAAMVYVKGGYAFADNSETLTLGGTPVLFAFDNNHRDGYTIGTGVEYMFAPNWSGKLEYQYYDFGSSRFVAPAAFVPLGAFRNDEHSLKAGVNYHFNWAGYGGLR